MAKGLDVGSMNIISATKEDGVPIIDSHRNSFVNLEHSDMVEQMISQSEPLHIRTLF